MFAVINLQSSLLISTNDYSKYFVKSFSEIPAMYLPKEV